MTKFIIGAVVLFVIYRFWKNRPIKNSNKLPQKVEIPEFDNPNNEEKHKVLQKGHSLILSRERGNAGFHLFATLNLNGKDGFDLEKIIISWSQWKERIYNFEFEINDSVVNVIDDTIKIDLGPFNNCQSSVNFLKRTVNSNIIKFDLLNYTPEYEDFEYEKDLQTQSVFVPLKVKEELKKFKKGLHYIDS